MKRSRSGKRIDGTIPGTRPPVWFPPFADVLPDTGELGETYLLTTDNLVYTYDGTEYLPSNNLGDGAVTTAKLANGAVTTIKIADANVTTAKILDANVTDAKLASNAVTTAKILDANVTNAKLAANAVDTTNVVDSAITTAKIRDAHVTLDKLATNSVDSTQIVDAAVTNSKLGEFSVTNGKLGLLSVATGNIQDNAITTAKITDLNVTGAKLGADSVTTTKIADSNVTAAKLASDAVTTVKILNANVTDAKLASGASITPSASALLKWSSSSEIGDGSALITIKGGGTPSSCVKLTDGSNSGFFFYGGASTSGMNNNAGDNVISCNQSTKVTTIGNTAGSNSTILQGAPRLSNLTTNGFVKTGSANGTLSVSTTVADSELTSGVTTTGEASKIPKLTASSKLDCAGIDSSAAGTKFVINRGLDLSSTSNEGIVLPAATSGGIGAPVSKMLIYDTGVNKLKFYNGSTWETITSA